MDSETQMWRRLNVVVSLFIFGLGVSGATAIPLNGELAVLTSIIQAGHGWPAGLVGWLTRVREGLADTAVRYPFMAYGTDWLAFGHFAIAIAFLGPLRDPGRNVWVVTFGLIA